MAPEPISKGFQRSANITFLRDLEEYQKETWWNSVCARTTSKSASEMYEWLAGLPGMKEWLGERTLERLSKYDYSIPNKDWEDTLQFKWNELRDNPQIVSDRLPGLVQSAGEHPTELLITLIVSGETVKCYDGEFFFSATHPSYEEGKTFSNLYTGTGITTDAIKADFDACELGFLSLKKRNGHGVFSGANLEYTIAHPITMTANMKKVFATEKTEAGGTNEYYGRAKLQPITFLPGNSWYITISNRAQKPFIFQEREKITPEWDFTGKFMRKIVLYGVDGAYNVGFGHPHLAIKVKQ